MKRVNLDLVKDLAVSTKSRIVLLVIDGLGGLPGEARKSAASEGTTELEKAYTRV